MNRTSDSIEILDEPRPARSEWMKWTLPMILLGLVLVLVAVAAVSGPAPSLWNTTDIVLFVLTALLCTLVGASLVLIGCGPWLTRIEAIQQEQGTLGTHVDAVRQGQGTLRTQIEAIQQAQWTVQARIEAIHQGQGRLRTQVEAVAETAKQTKAAVMALTSTEAGSGETAAEVAEEVTSLRTEHAARTEALLESVRILTATVEAVQRRQETLEAQLEAVAEGGRQASAAIAALGAEQMAAHETARQVADGVTGVGARQIALGEALEAHHEATGAALTAVNAGQEQLTGNLQQLEELTGTVNASVRDMAREQAAAQSQAQERGQVLTAALQTLRQSQQDLQGQVGTVVDGARQTIEAVAAIEAAQAATREMAQHVVDEVKGMGARQEQMAGDLRHLQDLTQTVGAGVADAAREQAAAHQHSHEQAQSLTGAFEALQQSQRDLHGEVATIADSARQTIEAMAAIQTAQAATRETAQHVANEIMGMGARQTALDEALRAHHEATGTALSAMTGGQEQLTGGLRQVQELSRTVGAGLAEVARRQAAGYDLSQKGTQALTAAIEVLQHNQQELQAQVETATESARQTIEAVTTMALEQNSVREATRHMIGEAAYAALAALTSNRRGLGASDEPQRQGLAQAIAGVVPDGVQPAAPAAEPAEPLRLSAAQAVTHGEQIRYEGTDSRDNLGYWANAHDWAEWEFELPRPGRFRVTADIAALAAGRFQMTVGEQALEATAPVTGDYSRFETVDLGVLELTTPGKTCLAVRPLAEDWQPMNLKSLDLIPVR